MPTSYPGYVRGMEGQQVDVLLPGFASGPKLLVNGVPASPGMAKNQYLLVTNDGQQLVAQLNAAAINFFVAPPKIPRLLVRRAEFGVGAHERIENSRLQPARVEFSRSRSHKTADVAADK